MCPQLQIQFTFITVNYIPLEFYARLTINTFVSYIEVYSVSFLFVADG